MCGYARAPAHNSHVVNNNHQHMWTIGQSLDKQDAETSALGPSHIREPNGFSDQ